MEVVRRLVGEGLELELLLELLLLLLLLFRLGIVLDVDVAVLVPQVQFCERGHAKGATPSLPHLPRTQRI